MISEKMIMVVKENADELTKRLCKDLLSRSETKSYSRISQDIVYERVYDVYLRLDSWLQGNKAKGEMRSHFIKLGESRRMEGIPLGEEIMTLMLIKRHVWLYVLEKNFLDSTFELIHALQFNNRVVMFFDRIMHYVTLGYEQEMSKAACE